MAPGRRTKKQSKSGKKESSSRAQHETRALRSLAEKRRAFEPLLRQIVGAVVHVEAPRPQEEWATAPTQRHPGTQNWIEVGSGLGQLRSLLPPSVLDFVTHTELSESLVRGLAESHPDARVLVADATRLPLASESLDAVLGLCVFDSLPRPAEASREIGRVLRPGGRFIHFLDAATNVEPILIDLVGGGSLPLPNFLADAALLEPVLLDRQGLDHLLGPYHDLLSVPVEQFQLVTEMLARAHHPMAEMLKKYAGPFLRRPFDAAAGARTARRHRPKVARLARTGGYRRATLGCRPFEHPASGCDAK